MKARIKILSAIGMGLSTAVFLWCITFIFTTYPNGFEIKNKKDSINYIKSTLPRLYVVESGSMEPAIKTGSLLLTLPQENYKTGDIISFKNNSSTVTHRIYSINEKGEYITKGDANEDPDNGVVKKTEILGKSVIAIPKLGSAANQAKNPIGFIFLVIVPATIIVYEEIRTVIKEIYKSILKIKNKKNRSKNSNNPENMTLLPKLAVFVPLIGSLLVAAAVTGSFFTDIESTVANLLQAGEYQGTNNGTLVINEVMPDTDCFVGNTEAQWIEIYNGTTEAVNPKDYKLSDGVNTITVVNANNLTISPGELLLLAHDNAIWNHCWSDNGTKTGKLGGQLNIDVGELRLIAPDNSTVDTVRWGNEETHQPIQNQSIEREPKGKDTAFNIDFNPNDFVIRLVSKPGL